MVTSAHSRLPVYRETLDDVLGNDPHQGCFANIASGRSQPVRELPAQGAVRLARHAAMDLLLRCGRTHAYGSRRRRVRRHRRAGHHRGSGRADRRRDQDEHDETESPRLVDRPDGSLLADARATIEELEARVGPVLSAEERADVDTIAGLVVSLIGRVPARGEIVRHPPAWIRGDRSGCPAREAGPRHRRPALRGRRQLTGPPFFPARHRWSSWRPRSPAAKGGQGRWSRWLWAPPRAWRLPPFDAAPALVVAFTGLIWLLDGIGSARAASSRLVFGFGFFATGLYWLANRCSSTAGARLGGAVRGCGAAAAFLGLSSGAALSLTWLTGWRGTARISGVWPCSDAA